MFFLALASNGCTSENGPAPTTTVEPQMVVTTYADCIYNKLKNTASESASQAITQGYRLKFVQNTHLEYASCLIDQLSGVSADTTATFIAQGCNLKFKRNRNIEYADCLLENMKGVKPVAASQAVISICQGTPAARSQPEAQAEPEEQE